MKRRGFYLVVAMLAACLLVSTHAFAQGGGASTTGSINGKVADSSGGVLPGVTVSATSPSSMGIQSSVTDSGGYYRFPALAPGTYTVTFELPGFNTLKRENISISMGFSAAINVELAVASLNETVTVTGDSPVIDTSNTRVQQNFKLEALQEIPNARDLWSLLALTPGGIPRSEIGRRLETRISVEFRDATLRAAIQTLCDLTGLNIVVKDEADVKVRLIVKDLTAKSVLRLLLQPQPV